MDPQEPVSSSSPTPQSPPPFESRHTARGPTVAPGAKQQTTRMAEGAKNQIAAFIHRRRTEAADSIGLLAVAVLQAAHTLDENDQPLFARSALAIAQKADGISRYVREKHLGDIARDTEALARRHPALFASATFTAGLLLARFLKSSRRRSESELASSGTPMPAWGEV